MTKIQLKRLKQEYSDVRSKYALLQIFMDTDTFKNLSKEYRTLLKKQSKYMLGYATILNDRLEYHHEINVN